MMAFVRVGQFKALPGTTDQLRRVYETEAIPVIRSAPGNVSAVLMQQREAPEAFMAITIWKTQGDAEAYDKSG
jgi:quinol monooxygenase YgiN